MTDVELAEALRSGREEAVEALTPYGVVDVSQKFDLVTLTYHDGYTYTKTQRELLYIASLGKIPRRPPTLH